MIKVLLAEDMTLTRTGLRALLENSGQVEVVGEAADGREAVKLAEQLNPDAVLMDVSMPGLDGVEATRQIRAARPYIHVLMLSIHSEGQYVFESLRAGAAGYVPKDVTIGIDMTPEMLERARQNAARGNDGQGYPNVEFHQATIDKLPLPDASVDCVISNCVINLAQDKPAVFREIARVLKPGGRLAVSDIALKKPLPAEIGQDLLAYVGCIAGAIPIEQYRRQLAEAGFAAVEVIDTGADLNAYAKVENQSGCCSPPASGLPVVDTGCCSAQPADDRLHRRLLELLRRYDVNDFAASVRVFAVKP